MLKKLYKGYIKRVLDISIALLSILLIFPILILCIILVKLTSKGPVFFKQERLGQYGKIFQILKLRTMYHCKREINSEVFIDNAEVTSIGKILRRYKLDELPQLFNILNGTMSLVGPRPAPVTHLDIFDEDGKKRLLVRPGLTGLAQINGNIFLDWSERWIYDRIYVEKLSFAFDVYIIFKTMLIVIFGEGKFVKKPHV